MSPSCFEYVNMSIPSACVYVCGYKYYVVDAHICVSTCTVFLTDIDSVVGGTKYQFRCSVVP